MIKKSIPLIALFNSVAVQAESAYELGAALTLESVANIDGGAHTGARELLNADLTLALDTAKAGWWSNGELFIYALGNYGHNPSDYVGDLQGVSNIAADNAAKIYEFWYQHSFADDRIKLLFGLHDYNSTFYSLDSAGLFTHASFGIGPETSQVGPSIFSTTATALVLSYQDDGRYLLVSMYDGIPGNPDNPRGTHIRFDDGDGVFSSAELGLIEVSNYKFGIGLWSLTAEVENPIDGSIDNRNHGMYFLAEKSFPKDLSVFLQLGKADDQYNQLGYYAGAGLTGNNVFKNEDALGLAVANARNGDPFLAVNEDLQKTETAWELTYSAPLMPHLNIQSSLYYIQNPSMAPSLDDAVAVGLRLYLEL
jgi:porin